MSPLSRPGYGNFSEPEIEIVLENEATARLNYRLVKSTPEHGSLAAHLSFIRYPETPLRLSDGNELALGCDAWSHTGFSSVSHQRWKLSLPKTDTRFLASPAAQSLHR